MTLEAKRGSKPFSEGAVAGAHAAVKAFEEIASFMSFIRLPAAKIHTVPNNIPAPVREMALSVLCLEEDDFTPMAAVAGTTSDFAAHAMVESGADYAIVNNGGDIAFCVPDGKTLKAGIISDIATGKVTHRLEIFGMSAGGFATSGLGGRSLTKGIAQSVTAIAKRASLADAAATAIANACICVDPAIERCFAEEIDYNSDIAGQLVTKSVGRLRKESVSIALEAGAERARELIDKNMIIGAVIFVSGKIVIVKDNSLEKIFEVTKL